MSSLIIEFFIENYIIRSGSVDIYLISSHCRHLLSCPTIFVLKRQLAFHLGPGPLRYLVGGSGQCAFIRFYVMKSCIQVSNVFLFLLLPSCYDVLIHVMRGCYLVSRIFLYWCLILNDLMWINDDRINLWRS